MKDAIMGGLFGLTLAIVGFNILTWQFWLIFAIAFVWRFIVAEMDR